MLTQLWSVTADVDMTAQRRRIAGVHRIPPCSKHAGKQHKLLNTKHTDIMKVQDTEEGFSQGRRRKSEMQLKS